MVSGIEAVSLLETGERSQLANIRLNPHTASVRQVGGEYPGVGRL